MATMAIYPSLPWLLFTPRLKREQWRDPLQQSHNHLRVPCLEMSSTQGKATATMKLNSLKWNNKASTISPHTYTLQDEQSVGK